MGGDLILSVVPMLAGAKHIELKEKAHERINGLTEQEVKDYLKQASETWKTETKEAMHKTVDDFFDSLDNRDVGEYQFGNVTFWITGGMSWGDSPTDSMDVFEKLNDLPSVVLDVIWAPEPKRNSA